MSGSIKTPTTLLSLALLVGISVYRANNQVLDFFSGLPPTQNSSDALFDQKVVQLRSNQGISLVTSYWAQPKGENVQSKNHEHRREVEAALLANLQNPYLHQVVVVYDSVSDETTDCQGFVEYMTRRLDNITRLSSPYPSTTENRPPPLPELQCIERRAPSIQPTYFEMFQYATVHPSITSEIVIMSNADQVFDDTIRYGAQIPKSTLFVLSTYGYAAARVPPIVRQQYLGVVGDDSGKATSDRCNRRLKLDGTMKRYSNSWDSYIFHRSLLRDTLTTNDDKKGGPFTRLSFRREPTAYYMNELGADYAALFDITRDLRDKVTVWNACKIIRSWHFHLASKTHHGGNATGLWPHHSGRMGGGYIFYEDYGPLIPRDSAVLVSTDTTANVPGSYVPPPYAAAPMCAGFGSCYDENLHIGAFFQSEPQRDASKFIVGQ
jgi:hypothetical protein